MPSTIYSANLKNILLICKILCRILSPNVLNCQAISFTMDENIAIIKKNYELKIV